MGKITVVAIDPGPVVSGMVVLRYGQIVKAANLENDGILFNIMLELDTKIPLLVLIEDVGAYGTRLSGDLVQTCKWLGKLEYWLKSRNIAYTLIFRSTVKKWVYDSYPEISIPRVEQAIIARDHRRKDGAYCKPSAKYVNDSIVEAAMRHAWAIEKPKPGKSNRYGITEHSYQALALACCYLDMKAPTTDPNAKASKHIWDAQMAAAYAIKASASTLGKLSWSKGGKTRAERLSPEKRAEIARKAAAARWGPKAS